MRSLSSPEYLFKGPDHTMHSIGSEDQPTDEIADWLRGRHLVATECAWRIFGYYTAYERAPTAF
eukprot:2704865-Pyramimonas_sp.AAC.1